MAIVSVSAIVYVILFDSTMAGLFPSSTNPTPSAANPLAPLTLGGVAPSPRTTDVQEAEVQELPQSLDGASGGTVVKDQLLSIRPEGSLTPQGRARLVDEVQGWLDRPIPGEFDKLREEFEAVSQLADSLALYRISLDEKLARAFTDKLGELRRYYLLQRTTLLLTEIATTYSVPTPTELERVKNDLQRFRELARDVAWVEERYSFVYPQDRKDYLRQLIEVLEGMERMARG